MLAVRLFATHFLVHLYNSLSLSLIHGSLIYFTKFLGFYVKTGCKLRAHFLSLSSSLFSISSFSLLIAHYNTCSAKEKAMDAREITMHKHKGETWLKKIHLIIESIKGQTKGDRAQGPLTKGSIGSTAPVVNKAGILVVQWPGIKTKGKQLDGLVTRWIKKCPANRAKGWSYLCMRAAKGLAAAPAKELTELLTRYPSRAARQETETENYSALPNNTKTVQKKVVHHHLFHGISSQVLQKWQWHSNSKLDWLTWIQTLIKKR